MFLDSSRVQFLNRQITGSRVEVGQVKEEKYPEAPLAVELSIEAQYLLPQKLGERKTRRETSQNKPPIIRSFLAIHRVSLKNVSSRSLFLSCRYRSGSGCRDTLISP
jgi:hypothetical protein